MVGLYPDAPGRKFAYDADGSVGFGHHVPSNVVSSLTAAQITTLNGEAGGVAYGSGQSLYDNQTQRLGFIFPELRDIVGVHCGIYYGGTTIGQATSFETSVDTTNGIDGTWTTRTVPVRSTAFRTGIQTYIIAGVKAVRWSATLGKSFPSVTFSQLHLYGELSSLSDRLAFWHPTLDQVLSPAGLDFGELPRSTVATKQFRIKNLSASITANNIVVSGQELTAPNPTIMSVTDFNAGVGYVAAPNIGALAPGAISGIITQRISLGSTAALSVWRQRIKAVAGSWT